MKYIPYILIAIVAIGVYALGIGVPPQDLDFTFQK